MRQLNNKTRCERLHNLYSIFMHQPDTAIIAVVYRWGLGTPPIEVYDDKDPLGRYWYYRPQVLNLHSCQYNII